MITKEVVLELEKLTKLVDVGEFRDALDGLDILYQHIKKLANSNNSIYYQILSNIANLFIDIGHMQPNIDSTNNGLNILESNRDVIINEIGESAYYYNLSNARSNLICEKNPFNHDFSTIEELVSIKNDLWKAIKLSAQNNNEQIQPTYIVNLGNILKQQFRLAEALECYDYVNSLNLDIPQSWINRSETLIMLNQVSNTYSIQMLLQIKQGYENILLSDQIPPQWIDHYKKQVESHQKKIDEADIEYDTHDQNETLKEFSQLSDFRKFCLKNNLILSEHGLYCSCAGSARDNLTIPTLTGVAGDFVVPMEMVLNRLKSEFSFARRLYFEYTTQDREYELLHESCFSELYNDELLGSDVERLRTTFRLCFGILDKIGIAICSLLNLYPSSGNVYFQSFWQLDRDDRRNKFNQYKNHGLLALYSIATGLNERKDGEWAFLKQWRNNLEHKFVVVHKSDSPPIDAYRSYEFINGIVFISERVFIKHLKRLLQITRSAIFSFVFTVRDKALKEKQKDAIYITNPILRQDYL